MRRYNKKDVIKIEKFSNGLQQHQVAFMVYIMKFLILQGIEYIIYKETFQTQDNLFIGGEYLSNEMKRMDSVPQHLNTVILLPGLF